MLGLCSVTFREKSVAEIIALVKEAGLETIEWGSDAHVPEIDSQNAKKVADQMAHAGLVSNSYGSYYQLGSFTSFTPYIEVAKILGAATIRVWAGKQGSAETNLEFRALIVEDTKRIGKLAEAENITISLECHGQTLTDTPQSASQLMREINSPNVLLYWQPAESLTVVERMASLTELAPFISNVHVFHWENYQNRYPLAEGFDEWKQYIDKIREQSPHEQDFLLEFVPGDDPVQGFFESAETLKKLVK